MPQLAAIQSATITNAILGIESSKLNQRKLLADIIAVEIRCLLFQHLRKLFCDERRKNI
jgi:hypothetical protein